MAQAVDPGSACLVGGCSFGGMVALEMTAHLNARACLPISSVRSPDQLPLRLRILKPLAFAIPRPLGGLPAAFAKGLLGVTGGLMRPTTRSLFQQLADADGRFMRWAALAALLWKPSSERPPLPVLQIHGSRDHVFPSRLACRGDSSDGPLRDRPL